MNRALTDLEFMAYEAVLYLRFFVRGLSVSDGQATEAGGVAAAAADGWPGLRREEELPGAGTGAEAA